jgi:hypothetical protein
MALKRIVSSEGFKSTRREDEALIETERVASAPDFPSFPEVVGSSTRQFFMAPSLYSYDAEGRQAFDSIIAGLGQGFGQAIESTTLGIVAAVPVDQTPLFFEDTPGFDPYDSRYDGMTISSHISRANAGSELELLAMNAALEREDSDRDIQERAGMLVSLVAAVPGMLIDPITFASFGAGLAVASGSTLLRTMGIMAVSNAAANTAAELPLLATQQRRTVEDAAFGVAAGTFLGTLIGTGLARVVMRPTNMAARKLDMVDDLAIATEAPFEAPHIERIDVVEEAGVPRGTVEAEGPGNAGVHPVFDREGPGGTALTEREQAKMGRLARAGSFIAPDTRLADGMSDMGRLAGDLLSDSHTWRNRTIGGVARPVTVSEKIGQWHDRSAIPHAAHEDAYVAYRKDVSRAGQGKEPKTPAARDPRLGERGARLGERDLRRLRDLPRSVGAFATSSRQFDTRGRIAEAPSGVLSPREFAEQVSDAIQFGDEVRLGPTGTPPVKHHPRVIQAAEAYRKYYGEMAEEIIAAQDAGILKNYLPKTLGTSGHAGTVSYLTRRYDHTYLDSNEGHNRFIDVVGEWLTTPEGRAGREADLFEDERLAREAAEGMWDTIMGSPGGRTPQGPKPVRLAGSLHELTLDLPDSLLAEHNFIVRDSRKLLEDYVNSVAPSIEMAKLGGSLELREQWRATRIWQLMDDDQKLARGEAEKLADKALDEVFAAPQDLRGLEELIDMERDFRIKELPRSSNREADRIRDAHRAAWKDVAGLRDAMTGNLGNPASATHSSWTLSERGVIDSLSAIRSLTYDMVSGSMVITQMQDVAARVIHKDMSRILKDTVLPFAGDMLRVFSSEPGSFRLGWHDQKHWAIGADMVLSSRTNALASIDAQVGRDSATGLDAIAARAAAAGRASASAWSKINQMSQWNTTWERTSAMSTLQEVFDHSADAASGTLSTRGRQLMGNLTLDEAMLSRIFRELDGKQTDRGWTLANSHIWDDQQAYKALQIALRADARRSVPKPSHGSLPLSLSDRGLKGGLLNTPAQFRKFPLMANTRLLRLASQMLHSPNWQDKMKVVSATTAAYGMTMAKIWIDETLKGNEDELREWPAERWLQMASERIDFYGITPDILGLMSDVSAAFGADWYQLENDQGEKVFKRFRKPWHQDLASSIGGASVGTIRDLPVALGALGEVAATDAVFGDLSKKQRRAIQKSLAWPTKHFALRKTSDEFFLGTDTPRRDSRSGSRLPAF